MQRSGRWLAELEQLPTSILFIDIVESVRLMAVREGETIRRWLGFVEQMERDILPGHDGRLIKRMGDGLLLEFSTPVGAAEAALEIMLRPRN